MVEMVMFNVQRAITPKVGKSELRFMSSACRLMDLSTSVVSSKYLKQLPTYRADISACRNDYFQYLLCLKGCNSKGR